MTGIPEIIMFGLREMKMTAAANKARLEKIRHQYHVESRDLPRKKKKAWRKRLIWEYDIFSWSMEMIDPHDVLKHF